MFLISEAPLYNRNLEALTPETLTAARGVAFMDEQPVVRTSGVCPKLMFAKSLKRSLTAARGVACMDEQPVVRNPPRTPIGP